MILSFHPCFMADVQIILGDGTLNPHNLTHIRDAKAILLPQACSLELYRACKNSTALLFPNYDTRFKHPGKIGQSLLFKKLKCPHPETRLWISVREFEGAFRKAVDFPHRMPFFIKADTGHQSERVYLIRDGAAMALSLEALKGLEASGAAGFISQEAISTEGNVLRAVIVGRKIITYWKRAKRPEQLVTTISRGAKIDGDWRMDLQEKGRVQAQKLSAATGINLAAVDFVFHFPHLDPQPLFLEINYYFGRRGLGGAFRYYRLLYQAIQAWLVEKGFDPKSVSYV